MSNFEYDRLYDELRELESKTGFVLSNSPTLHAGYEVAGELQKERHPSPMLSLDKTKDREALREWLGSRKGVLSWKMDGLTIVLTYEGGKLAKAVTRGNGEIGEVVTANVKTFTNVPLQIPFEGRMVIRGEAIIGYSDFEEINRSIEDADAKYKNPRNLCSGSVRQLDPKVTAKRKVKLFVFALIEAEGKEFSTVSGGLDWLDSIGFTTVERREVTSDSIIRTIEEFSKAVADNDFPSDGLVLIYDDVAYGRSLGRTSKFPRDAIAFKWADEIRETKILYVEWSASRTGLINPVAVFEPVELEGTTVSRASLHNISVMEGLELGIGDTVTVYKANMIIPQIADNLTRSGVKDLPKVCPSCGGETEVSDQNGVKTLVCRNKSCPAKRIKLFAHFVSRDALNIEGLSEQTLEKFVDRGFVKSLTDIFRIESHREEIVFMDGFGERSFANLKASVDKARKTSPERLIYGLGIPGIGLAGARLMCARFDGDVKRALGADVSELTQIEGFGEVLAGAVAEYYADEENRKLVDELLEQVELEAKEKTSDSLSGLTFVITGSVEKFANRKELEEYIISLGGKTASSVSKNTDYLINNDATSGSSKNKKAHELGVKIVTEDEFIALAKGE